MVLNSGTRTLAHQSVTVSVHPAPDPLSTTSAKAQWDDEELIEQAGKNIIKELRGLLEKDVMDRVVGSTLRKVAREEKGKKEMKFVEDGVLAAGEHRHVEKKGLKGLSFKKHDRRVKEEESEIYSKDKVDEVVVEVTDEAEVTNERRKKRQKKEVPKEDKKGVGIDVESEDEEEPALGVTVEEVGRKRLPTEEFEDGTRVKKKLKKSDRTQVKKKTTSKKKIAKPTVVDVDVAHVAKVYITPERSPSPGRSLSPRPTLPPYTRTPSPPPDPLKLGLCDDDEDLYFTKAALSLDTDADLSIPESSSPEAPAPFRKHITGSARTEGYYKISHAEKQAYVAQYALRTAVVETVAPVDVSSSQHVTSSRSNRANARRRAQGLEEINQVQRAVALSKGETAAAELNIKFNQLQTRKKHLRFARSRFTTGLVRHGEDITRRNGDRVCRRDRSSPSCRQAREGVRTTGDR
jgi:histone-lysine N-methyltransferase SETD1